MGKDKLPSEMNPEKLPDGRAFEDEFTRQFLQSTEEVKPGYYPFLARNGKFKLAFPTEGIMDSLNYRTNSNFEAVSFTDWAEGRDSSASVSVSFHSTFNPGFIESKQRNIMKQINLPLEFEEISGDEQTYYLAPFVDELDDESIQEIYGYGAYIQKESEAGGIFVYYSSYCEANCDENREADMQEAYDFILSIHFLEEVEEKEEP